MLISIFLFTIAFLGCYDESTWYFVVVEINEISCIERRWIWNDLQTRPIIKLLKHNRCFTVNSRNTIFAWNWEKLIFFCCVFFFLYFWGNALWNNFIMFNSEKCRENSLVFVCHSVWVSGPLQLLGHYFLPGQESNGHLSNHHYTFNQLGECKYKIYKMTEVVTLHFAHTYWPYHYKYGGKMLTFSITCNTTVYKLKLCWGCGGGGGGGCGVKLYIYIKNLNV